jgi:UDP-N-acetyl-D-mannosaminuronic acid dehydrogenase
LEQLEKIAIIGGAGRVGLPLALVLSDANFKVVSVDIDMNAIGKIKNKLMPFFEAGAQQILDSNLEKSFYISSDFDELNDSQIVILVIGTDLDKSQNPNPDKFLESVKQILPYLDNEKLFILRSTISSGLYSKAEKLVRDIHPNIVMGYCPERILEGNALNEIRELPQVIGVRSDREFDSISAIFSKFGVETIRATPEEAELIKLFTNTWRYAKFAIANEFWKISNEKNLDYFRIREIIIKDYPRAKDLPSAGFAAGPCLYKDTVQLYNELDPTFQIGLSAIKINENLPQYLIDKILEVYDLKKLRVGILGLTFKANSDDLRNSLSVTLKELLATRCHEVLSYDPFLENNEVEIEELLRKSELIVIGTPHDSFKNLDFICPVIDIWGSVKKSARIE